MMVCLVAMRAEAALEAANTADLNIEKTGGIMEEQRRAKGDQQRYR
jgi:hypothetical protein